jgi:hypothetical protein
MGVSPHWGLGIPWLVGLFDAVFEGVAHEFVFSGEVKFGEDVADVVLDGLLGDEELGADLAVGVAAGDELEDFAFALGEGLGSRCGFGDAPALAEHEGGKCG